MLAKETNPSKLFHMYQELREVIAKETGEDTSFTMSLRNGKTVKVKNLAEARAAFNRS
jgi:hypothetical protein